MKYKKIGDVWTLHINGMEIEGSLEFVQKQAMALIDKGIIKVG